LSIFRTFCGVGDKKLPKGSFARILLILFIFWCLVVRTAYQGKLFEFTTSAIRKPEIMSLEELRNKNFTLFVSNGIMNDQMTKFVRKIIG